MEHETEIRFRVRNGMWENRTMCHSTWCVPRAKLQWFSVEKLFMSCGPLNQPPDADFVPPGNAPPSIPFDQNRNIKTRKIIYFVALNLFKSNFPIGISSLPFTIRFAVLCTLSPRDISTIFNWFLLFRIPLLHGSTSPPPPRLFKMPFLSIFWHLFYFHCQFSQKAQLRELS